MKASASGMPAKFEATPENVMTAGRRTPRQPAEDDGVGEQEAEEAAEDGRDEADLDARPMYALRRMPAARGPRSSGA